MATTTNNRQERKVVFYIGNFTNVVKIDDAAKLPCFFKAYPPTGKVLRPIPQHYGGLDKKEVIANYRKMRNGNSSSEQPPPELYYPEQEMQEARDREMEQLISNSHRNYSSYTRYDTVEANTLILRENTCSKSISSMLTYICFQVLLGIIGSLFTGIIDNIGNIGGNIRKMSITPTKRHSSISDYDSDGNLENSNLVNEDIITKPKKQ
jgi:hypothetical protein